MALFHQGSFGFSSKSTDDEVGLVYFGLRFYCSRTGSWVNRDPSGEGAPTDLEDVPADWATDIPAGAHQQGTCNGVSNSENCKRCGPDGDEGIYTLGGEAVTDPVNGGTYNYVNAGSLPGDIGHVITDVFLYIPLGNSWNR